MIFGQVSLDLKLSPLKNADSVTEGVAIVVDDLTELRQQQAKLSVVRRYLPSFRVLDEQASAEVTIRNLLTHSPGWEANYTVEDLGRESLGRWVRDREGMTALLALATLPGRRILHPKALAAPLARECDGHRPGTSPR